MATAPQTTDRKTSRAASATRAAATAVAPATTPRTPAARAPSTNTTQAAEAAAVIVDNLATKPLMILAAKNPKRAGTKAWSFFEKYTKATTVREALNNGVRGKDLSWDVERGHVLVGDDVATYQALKTDDERRAFLDSKGFEHKMAGLYVEPVVVPPAAEEAKVEGEKTPA